ncbi:hypothetical protein PMZ80_002320 [Knufia obscura]|uniref:cyclic pyranopterin monophosphate synthase n=1 Tax=Knufia obscura TaxID=1635080 RepID=A0ABR0RWZ5_9EURO|nr:hypothetical protein PMZ80_002320 [Knufia obscura]
MRNVLKAPPHPAIPLHILPPNTLLNQQTRVYSTSRVHRTHSPFRSIRHYSQPTKQHNTNPNPTSTTTTPNTLTHLTPTGAAHMVDISHKTPTTRLATAVSTLLFSHPQTYTTLTSQSNAKGDAIAVSRIAAIQAAKKTSDLIPLAHPSLNITAITVDITPFSGAEQSISSSTTRNGEEVSMLDSKYGGVTVRASVKCQGKTGVEMEAITAATMGCVTLYDMLKAVDKGMVISGARVVEKRGGKSGDWVWDEGRNRLVRPGEKEGERGGVKDMQGSPVSEIEDVGSQEQRRDTRMDKAPLSEVEEWNEGLAAEFSIMDEVEALESERRH